MPADKFEKFRDKLILLRIDRITLYWENINSVSSLLKKNSIQM